jgi:hypothetical protein
MDSANPPSAYQRAIAITAGVLMALLVTGLAHWGGSSTASGPRTVSLGPYVLNNTTMWGYELSFPTCSFVRVSWHTVFGLTANFSALYPGNESVTTCSNYSAPSNDTCPPSACGGGDLYGPVRGSIGVACFEQGRQGNCTWTSTVSSYGFGLVGFSQLNLEGMGLLIVSFTVVYTTDG